MNSRRNFIKKGALLVSALPLSSFKISSTKFNKLGIQLYTLRSDIEKGIVPVIKQLAGCGYNDVETYDFVDGKYSGMLPEKFKELLNDNGLISSSGHFELSGIITDNNFDVLKHCIEGALKLGQKNIVLPHLDANLRSTEDHYKIIADRLNKGFDICKSAGIGFSYHNHDFEFAKFTAGETGYDILLNNTVREFKFEMDLYWVVRAGQNPISFFKKYPGRFAMWHVKDMSQLNPDQQTEIGKGRINFAEIFAQAKLAGAERIFVEQENNYQPDIFKSIAESSSYIKHNLI